MKRIGIRFASFAAVGAFVFSILEVVIMLGPFAAYFYAVYGPILSFFQSSSALCWLGDFFASHISEPLQAFRPVMWSSRLLLWTGTASFVVHAAHLYWMKFVRHGVASRLLYSHVRHPQYLSLMLAGLGLALRWPRFVNLLLWLLMCAAYRELGLYEERRMERLHAQEYGRYRENKGMFLPLRAGVKGAGWLLSLTALLLSFGLRSWSVRRLAAMPVPSMPAALALAPADYLPYADLDLVAARITADQGAPPAGSVLLLYFVRDRRTLEHLLDDSGAPPLSVRIDAAYFVLAARAFYPCLAAPCPMMRTSAEALSPFALRRPSAIYYAPVSANRALERAQWQAEPASRRSAVPVL